MTTKEKTGEKDERKENLKKVKNKLSTHVLEVELEIFGSQQKVIEDSQDHARIIRNTVMGEMIKNLEQMKRTRIYRETMGECIDLKKKIATIEKQIEKDTIKKKEKELKKKKNDLEKELKNVSKTLEFLREKFGVTKSNAANSAKVLQKKFNKAQAVIAQKMSERVWSSIERIMYGDAEKPRYIGKEYFTSIEGKQNEKCIMLKQDEEKGLFYISYLGETMYLKPKKNDLFVQETLANIAYYENNKQAIDDENIKRLLEEKELIDTYRVKYNRIIRKEIRGKMRYFVQIVIEGKAVAKRKKDGSFRHTFGTGVIGLDSGMQATAYVSEKDVDLYNLAERGEPNTKKIKELQRAQDRSRRKMNKDCYDKKGRCIKRPTKKSKKYIKRQQKIRDLYRKDVANRKYAHEEKANYLRSIGDVVITELMNWKGLAKRAKETTVNEKTGKINRKKRGGKSIGNRSPGYAMTAIEKKFKATGGSFKTVKMSSFKASQYDHMLDASNKKQLSMRWHQFENGEKVQRDMYSAFLLMCANDTLDKPCKQKCDKLFAKFKKMHETCIQTIKKEKINIYNSGIKIS